MRLFVRFFLLLASAMVLLCSTASAKPLGQVRTARSTCAHGTRAVWSVAYETFGRVAFRSLNGKTTFQNAPDGGRPNAGLLKALQQTANTFGSSSRCAVGLRFDIYSAPTKRLALRQEPYTRLLASNLPRPVSAPGGPATTGRFYSRYDTVMEQFSALAPNGETLLGPGYEGETFGYVSLMDATTPDSSVLVYELLQGMSRYFITHGARFAPNPQTGVDAYCTALKRLGYDDLVKVSPTTCTSDRYALDVIAGRVPEYHGITTKLWTTFRPSLSYRLHRTIPAGLPAGNGGITSGADA